MTKLRRIDNNELQEILEKHKSWLQNCTKGERANLSKEDLSKEDLSKEDLSKANLSYANLSKADLRGVKLKGANLRGANLSGAKLRGANLSKADLSYADLSKADLRGVKLKGANLRGANLSGAKGLLNDIDYLAENFEKTDDGYVGYKVFGMYYSIPYYWKLQHNEIIEEVVNSNRTDMCGCGINIATKEWIKREKPLVTRAWKVLIKWEWLSSVVVPYNTDGKIRCGRAMLLEEVEI